MIRALYIIILIIVILITGYLVYDFNGNDGRNKNILKFLKYKPGDPVDSLNGVYVYYNGKVSNVSGRNNASDGYNIGLKYQCVEFVKRYYYQYLNHKMTDSYGHAKDFFDSSLKDGQLNKKRNLTQHSNPGESKPVPNDLLVYAGTKGNPYGHVAIVSEVTDNEIEIVQQNPGKYSPSRVKYKLSKNDGKWKIESKLIIGWLRK